jgi:MATE family multidrug resistance protein
MSVNKEILRLTVPNVISNISVPLLGMVDVAIAGRIGGDMMIGALAIGTTIFNFIYWNCAFLRMGTSGLTAQAFGAGNRMECNALLVRALAVAMILSGLLLIFQKPLSEGALYLMGGSAEVSGMACDYVMVRIWAVPAAISIFALQGWFIGMQDSKTPMWVSIFANVLNVTFSVLFAIVLDMGIAGIAWGTVVSQYLSLGLALLIYRIKYYDAGCPLEVRRSLRWSKMMRFFQVNRDVFLRTFCVVVAYTLFTKMSAYYGDVVLATNSLLMQMFTLFSYMIDGVAYAAEAISGRCIGERNYVKLRRSSNAFMVWGGVIAVVYVAIYCVAWQSILGLFSPSEDVMACAGQYIGWIIAVPLVCFVPFMIDGIMLGATRTAPLRNTVAISLGIQILLLLLLKDKVGNMSVWISFLAFLFMRGMLLVPELRKLMKEG